MCVSWAMQLSLLALVFVTGSSAVVVNQDPAFAVQAVQGVLQGQCGLQLLTSNTPFYPGPLAEPYKNTSFVIQWACEDGSNSRNEKFVIRSKTPTGQAEFGYSPALEYKSTRVGMTELVVEACPAASADTSDASNDLWCKDANGPVTYKLPVLLMYVRREVRSLPPDERKRFFESYYIMANTSTAEGKLKYGPRFVNYYEINAKHAAAVMSPPCDLAHAGPAFFTYHRALTREWEASMQAIDPSLALPYWDMFFEGEMEDPSKSPIWSNDFYGGLSGDPNDLWIVKDGQFPYWKVPGGEEAQYWQSLRWGNLGAFNWTNPYGFNRRPDNMNRAGYITRVGVLGNYSTPFAKRDHWRTHCKPLTAYSEYRICVDYISGAHTTGHVRIGGTSGIPPIEEIMDKIDCKSMSREVCERAVKDVQLLVAVAHGIGYGIGCLSCTKQCKSVEEPATNCACEWQSENPLCTGPAMAKSTMESTVIFEEPFSYMKNDALVEHAFSFAAAMWGNPNTFMGEYQDTATSATDPVFWVHHSNIDRLFASWRRAHMDIAWEDAGFNKPVGTQTPETPVCYGHHLHDPLAKNSFHRVYNSQRGIKRALTNFDMCQSVDVEIRNPELNDYIFDRYEE